MPEQSSKPATKHIGEEAEEELASLAPEGRRIIAAVAVNRYEHHAPLGNAVNDAKSVLELFKECGFEELPDARSLFNAEATREAIITLVTEQLATELAPDDSLVLFYAGHGKKTEKQVHDPYDPTKMVTRPTGYLIPADAREAKPADWIRLEGFLDDVSGLPARHVLVILDACNSGIALSNKFKFRGGEAPASVAELRSRVSRRVITSAMHDQKAVDGGSGTGHSLFAEAMIDAIRNRKADENGDGFVKSRDLHSYVQDSVSSGAKMLYGIRQTPDYGQLPGDGSGDMVLSLKEGAFSRMKAQAYAAMLRLDVNLLEELVAQLAKVREDSPEVLYLQYRLHFMRGNPGRALGAVSNLYLADYRQGTIPLSKGDLDALRVQIAYWQNVLGRSVGTPPIEVRLLTRTGSNELAVAPSAPFPGGDAYQIEDGAIAQLEVRNLGDVPAHLYYIAVMPLGRLLIGPLLQSDESRMEGLAPGAIERGPRFKVKGLPGSVTETRIYYSTVRISPMLFPPTTAARAIEYLDPTRVLEMQMTPIWHQITGDTS